MTYVFDSNSITGLSFYFPNRFPTFWRLFEAEVETEQVISVREVYKELENHAYMQQWLGDWLKQHKTNFRVPTSDEMLFVGELFKVTPFQALVGEKQRLRGGPVADPFLIACAKICGGTVITQESRKDGAARIPNVCEHFNVPCSNLEGFLAEKDWKF